MKKELGIFVLLVVLCVIVSVINPNFLLAINLQNLARQIGAFGIFSIGLGLVIITGGIELSVGSMMALLGVLMSMMLTEWRSRRRHRGDGVRRDRDVAVVGPRAC